MGFEDEVEQSNGRPFRQTDGRVQAEVRTHLIHRPARDIIPPMRWSSSILLSHLILKGRHVVTASLVQRNSVPSTQIMVWTGRAPTE